MPGTGHYRSPALRLRPEVHCSQRQAPPWHDRWAIEMDETSLTQLSAELIQLPEPLTPYLRLLRKLTEQVVAHGLETHQAAQAPRGTDYYERVPETELTDRD
jgi:hypothetical protein